LPYELCTLYFFTLRHTNRTKRGKEKGSDLLALGRRERERWEDFARKLTLILMREREDPPENNR
jgi:hypothetical protein